ncbi:hypothetical protein SSX86_009270 [Deinandra increscens subsp. villosa]|uniref:Bifunctional inhibitor/plant lipid transfer protein/seed storage helical domain-containing protein n=1 Tax=Deinandra increscens subsp. villosa TaxID=3103831 RepID=A0AAP0DCZ2_9ASTR
MATHSLTCILFFMFFLIFTITFSTACGTCRPKVTPPSPPGSPLGPTSLSCPRDALKLGVCADVLGLVNAVVGTPESSKCCALLEGLVDLEVAACLCTAIKANVLGINLNVPISLSLLVSACEKTVPPGFKC